jgi:hypothetical protein
MGARAKLMADSAAFKSLSDDGKKVIAELYHLTGGDPTKRVQIEIEPGRWITVKLSDKWRDHGPATPGNMSKLEKLRSRAGGGRR